MIDAVEFGKAMGAIVKDAVAPLLKRIEQLEARELVPGPAGEKGESGKDAEPVAVPDVVAELVSTDALAPILDLYVTEAVAKYFEANPVKHGVDGKDGKDGKDGVGIKGEKGDPGDKGADGVGLADAVIDREGHLAITKTNGEVVRLGLVVGKDGSPGRDGADFTEVEIDYDGERGLVISGKGGQIVKRMPIPLDKGYWREGTKAQQADVMTHEGNAWIALKDTEAKPSHEAKEDWRMLARRGKDGPPGPAGKEYRPPSPVRLGND